MQANHAPPILSVTQLTHEIKQHLEKSFPNMWLQGEISNFKPHSSGHLYLSLKDAGAAIKAVMFRNEAARLKFPLQEGMHVVVRGTLNVYPPSGSYQIVIREIRQLGLGELLANLEELKKTLRARGWFDQVHKKAIPKFPKRIGVVTSPTGAAIRDILNVLEHRYSSYKLLLNPVRVQGEGAALEIARAIREFNDYALVDVIIVGRGGGSIEDLWAFNEEVVAQAIFHSHIPIISAVGHESDVCLSDFVADMRAATPSAAAACVIAEKRQLQDTLNQIGRRLEMAAQSRLQNYKQKLFGLARQPMMTSPYAILGRWMQFADDMRSAIDQRMSDILFQQQILLDGRKKQLSALEPSAQIDHLRQRLKEWQRVITASMSYKWSVATWL